MEVVKGATADAERFGTIPRDPQRLQPRNLEGKPDEGRGSVCARMCVCLCVCARVRACERLCV